MAFFFVDFLSGRIPVFEHTQSPGFGFCPVQVMLRTKHGVRNTVTTLCILVVRTMSLGMSCFISLVGTHIVDIMETFRIIPLILQSVS